MKKLILTVFIISLICATGFVYATETANTEFNVTPRGNIEDPIFSGDENLEATTTNLENPNDMMQIINDDVYLIDEKVEMIGTTIQGNAYVIAEEIKIENVNIDGNLFLIGKDVELKYGTISGSAYIIAEDFESNFKIRDLYLLGDELNLLEDSYVERNARILGQKTIFNGIITDNCYLFSDNIDIMNAAKIGGTLSYYSAKEANIENSANIGNIDFHLQEESVNENENEIEKTATVVDKVYDLIGAAIKVAVIAGAIVFLSSKTIKANKEITVGTFFKCLGIGILIFSVVPFVAIALIISIIGIGLIVLAIYAIMLYISSVVACLAIASTVVKEDSKWKVFGVTIGIYLAIRLISIFSGLGVLVSMLMGLAGLGFMVRNIWYKENKEVIEVVNKEI